VANRESHPASTLWFFVLVLVAAGLSALDVDPGGDAKDIWSTAFAQVGPGRVETSDAGGSTRFSVLRVTCREGTGDERVLRIRWPHDAGQSPAEVLAAARALLELHFTGCVSLEVVATAEDLESSADDAELAIRPEWE
jgi:hypothetical protein